MGSFVDAYETYGSFGDGNGQAECLWFLDKSCRAISDYEAADRYLSEGLALARTYGNRFREGVILAELGQVRLAQGDRNAAISCWTHAAAVLHGVSPKEEATVRGLLEEVQGAA